VADRDAAEAFVGRVDELSIIERAVAGAGAGMPTVLLVGGDAGIGKSTLVRVGCRRAGAALHLARCVHLGGDVITLAPLADLLRQVRRLRPELLDEHGPHAALARWQGSASAGRQADPVGGLFEPVLDLTAALAADGPVALAFEDLHWADPVSWDLFEFLARNLIDERVVLIGTYRANEVGADPAQRRRLAELTRLPATQRIHLGGLSRRDVEQRVRDLLGDDAVAPSVVDEVLARGQGNPFFTEELVAAHRAGEAIPAVLSDLISADLAGLDERARLVLGALAAIGRDADHGLLEAAADVEGADLERALRSAVDAQLVVVDPATETYRFRHALIGEVAYGELLPPQRTRLHRRIADALRAQGSADLGRADRAGELAFHLDRAGDVPGAFAASLAAADAAVAVAPGAALTHLERALALWDAAGDASAGESRAERTWQAAELASAAVSNGRAVELARVAFTLGPPPLGEAWGHERLGRYLWA
jgi:predicted ATPase